MDWPDSDDTVQEDVMLFVSQAFDRKDPNSELKMLSDRNLVLEAEVANLRRQRRSDLEEPLCKRVRTDTRAKSYWYSILRRYMNEHRKPFEEIADSSDELVMRLAILTEIVIGLEDSAMGALSVQRQILEAFKEFSERLSTITADVLGILSAQLSNLVSAVNKRPLLICEAHSTLSRMQLLLLRRAIELMPASQIMGKVIAQTCTCQNDSDGQEKADLMLSLIEKEPSLRPDAMRGLALIGQLPKCNINSILWSPVEIVLACRAVCRSKNSDKHFMSWFGEVLKQLLDNCEINSSLKRVLLRELLLSLKWRLGGGRFRTDVNQLIIPACQIQIACLHLEQQRNPIDKDLFDYYSNAIDFQS